MKESYFDLVWTWLSANEKEQIKKEAMEALSTPNPFDRVRHIAKPKKKRVYRPKRGGK